MKAAHSNPRDQSKTKSKTDTAGKGDNSTVILRTPVPKYGHFISAKKKPKEGAMTSSLTGNVREMSVNLSHLNQPSGRITGSTAPIIVGKKTNEALRAKGHDQIQHKSNQKDNLQPSTQNNYTQGNTVQVQSLSNGHSSKKQVMHVAPQKCADSQTQGEKTHQHNAAKLVSVVDPIHNQQAEATSQLAPGGVLAADQTNGCGLHKSDSFTSNSNIFLEQWTKSASEAMCLKEENNTLKTQLEVQLQVNKELKRLLVASVGEDLCQRVENLIRDKAELSAELGDFAKKMSEDYENLDKVSIQADMWRSKYIASRLMIDELAKNKAFYGMQYQESQRVLQEMLTERHELRTNLSESYRCLQHVRDAFDPLNTHKSSNLQCGNVIDLAKTIQNLAETIRFRLLPAGSGFRNNSYNKDMQAWPDALTKGESSAQELLSRKIDVSSDAGSLVVSAPNQFKIDRYHPQAAFDNLTLNCCGECKGDIKLL